MEEVYDKVRTAALISEAKEITAGLKAEIGIIQAQMDRVLEGGEEAADTGVLRTLHERNGGKSFWRFWR
jgi:hypothetical protein